MEILGYDLADFDEIPGRFYYNSGATYRNYVNVFWNDPERPWHKNSSRTMTVVLQVKVQQSWPKNGIQIGFLFLQP